MQPRRRPPRRSESRVIDEGHGGYSDRRLSDAAATKGDVFADGCHLVTPRSEEFSPCLGVTCALASSLVVPPAVGTPDVVEDPSRLGFDIDAYARVTVLHQVVTVDAHILVASVDVYLCSLPADNMPDRREKGSMTRRGSFAQRRTCSS